MRARGGAMRRVANLCLLLALVLLPTRVASAQKSPWDVSGLRELGNISKSVSRADRTVIAKRLRAKPDEFRIERIETAGTHIFCCAVPG